MIVIGFILLFIGYRLLVVKTPSEELADYLINRNFVKKDGVYVKQISDVSLEEYYEYKDEGIEVDSETLYFDVNSFQLIDMSFDYSSNVELYFNPTYNYTNGNLIYNYEINMDNTNVMIEGSYSSNDDFVCDIINTRNINLNGNKNDICEKVKFDVVNFYDYALGLIKDKKLLKKISNN